MASTPDRGRNSSCNSAIIWSNKKDVSKLKVLVGVDTLSNNSVLSLAQLFYCYRKTFINFAHACRCFCFFVVDKHFAEDTACDGPQINVPAK